MVLLGLLGFFAILPLQASQVLQLVDANVLGVEACRSMAVEHFHIVEKLLQLISCDIGVGQLLLGAAFGDGVCG